MAHDIFISHANDDKTIADMVCATLERHGLRCWIAPRDIQPGADWGSAIVDAIRNSRVMVLVFSDAANTSHHIPREIERAIGRQIPVVPVRIEEVEPRGSLEYSLSSVHWLDAITPPVEAHILRLAATLRSILGLPPEQAAAPSPTIATVAPTVEALEPEPARTIGQPTRQVQETPPRRPLSTSGVLVGSVAVLLVAIAGVFWYWSAKSTSDPSVAVDGERRGTYLVLQVASPGGAALAEVRQVIRRRLMGLGISDPSVTEEGATGDLLRVSLPFGVDAERAKGVIRIPGVFEMKLVEDGPGADQQTLVSSSGGTIPDRMEIVPGLTGDGARVYYLVTRVAAITRRDVRDAKPIVDEFNRPAISMTLNGEGVDKFARLTGENVGRLIAIILDGVVMSAPRIEGRVSTPEVRITGSFTQQEAADLSLILRTEALPASVTFLQHGVQK